MSVSPPSGQGGLRSGWEIEPRVQERWSDDNSPCGELGRGPWALTAPAWPVVTMLMGPGPKNSLATRLDF